MLLALVLVVGSGGFLGVSIFLGKVSLIGSVLVTVAFAEAIAIMAGFFVFRRRQLSKT